MLALSKRFSYAPREPREHKRLVNRAWVKSKQWVSLFFRVLCGFRASTIRWKYSLERGFPAVTDVLALSIWLVVVCTKTGKGSQTSDKLSFCLVLKYSRELQLNRRRKAQMGFKCNQLTTRRRSLLRVCYPLAKTEKKTGG